MSLADQFRRRLKPLPAGDPQGTVEIVEAALATARDVGASDVHWTPAAEGLHLLFRVDGVLQPVAEFGREQIPRVAARLKVVANLLTYHTEVPQEGRIRQAADGIEMRVSTFPTLHGEKVVVRMFVGSGRYRTLDDLGLDAEILASLRGQLVETGGLIVVTGPAGSGKTTTLYACLREIIDRSPHPRSIATLEDPIEAAIPGAAQSQVNAAAGFDLATGLRSLLRQDPEVILVGEIRDRSVAEIVFQAALTGHLVLTSFHAGSAAGAVSRLLDMGLEPYQLRSGIRSILSQRLVRRLCRCARTSDDPPDRLGFDTPTVRLPQGCDACRHTGYLGRLVLTEMLSPEPTDLGRAILSRSDAAQLEAFAVQSGMTTRWERGLAAIREGATSPEEVRRVLGFQRPASLESGETLGNKPSLNS